jgi:hypothetical protein
MKTESSIPSSILTLSESPAQADIKTSKIQFEHSDKGASLTGPFNKDPSISIENVKEDGWNNIKLLRRESGPEKTLTEQVETGLKLGKSATSTFPSMIIAFLVMCIQLFANLQKAQMDNVMNQLNFMLMDMKRQIEAMKDEQKSNFTKDMLMAGIETASAAVQLVGSCYTTAKLGAKITEQSTLNNKEALGKLKPVVDNKASSLPPKSETASKMAKSEALSSNEHKGIVDEVGSTKDAVKASMTERQKVDADTANDSITTEELGRHTGRIRSEVDYINARQQAFTAASALMKAFSPLVQGVLGSEATTHQIEAREAENAKEINNSFSRQHSEAATGMRDVIMKLLGLLQDLQSIEPNNALASSRKMA